MTAGPDARWASERLPPGGTAVITEAEWFHFLEHGTLLHQWSNVFLVDGAPTDGGVGRADGRDGSAAVRAYVRDDSGAGRHQCRHLDAAASARARAGVEEIEALSRAAADLITANQGRSPLSPADLGAEQAASARLVARAEAVYAELLGSGGEAGGPAG